MNKSIFDGIIWIFLGSYKQLLFKNKKGFISKRIVKNTSAVTLRSVILGLILIPINCYWIMYTEMVWWAQFPTTMSLFFNVIFCLAIIIPINLLIHKLSPKLSLNQAELLVIYVMLCMASAVASHDNLQVLIPMIGHVFWFDTPEMNGRSWSGNTCLIGYPLGIKIY